VGRLLRKSRACGAQDRWSTALTTGPFLPLVSHYLFDSDFARVGQEHDNGGVESRGKPIPRGDSLDAISCVWRAKQCCGALLTTARSRIRPSLGEESHLILYSESDLENP
jgi:hypothetical protein